MKCENHRKSQEIQVLYMLKLYRVERTFSSVKGAANISLVDAEGITYQRNLRMAALGYTIIHVKTYASKRDFGFKARIRLFGLYFNYLHG